MKKITLYGIITILSVVLVGCSASSDSNKNTATSESNSISSSINYSSEEREKGLTFEQFELLYPEYEDAGFEEISSDEWAYGEHVKIKGTVLDVIDGRNAKFILAKNKKEEFLVGILPEDYSHSLEKGDKFISYGVVTDEQEGYPVLGSMQYYPDIIYNTQNK